ERPDRRSGALRRGSTHAHYSRDMARWAPEKKDQLESIADEILHNYGHGRTMVAVDGRHGAGQRDFADGLAETLEVRATKVLHDSIVGFFGPLTSRVLSGRHNGRAHYRETYYFSILQRVYVDPFHTGDSIVFVITRFDAVSDQPHYQCKWMSADTDAVL